MYDRSNKQFPHGTTLVRHADNGLNSIIFINICCSLNLFYIFFSYRIVYSPNNALLINQEDIDQLISNQDDISCKDIVRDEENIYANCEIFKNGDKECQLNPVSYVEKDPETFNIPTDQTFTQQNVIIDTVEKGYV